MYSEAEILKKAVETGTIDLASVYEQIMKKEQEELLQKHKYEIWQGKNGLWYTYLPDTEKGRKLIKRISEESLHDAIITYYKGINQDSTVEEVYREWVDEKLKFGDITQQSYDRYNNNFKRFFLSEKTGFFGKMHFKYITDDELEFFIKNSIKEHHLSQKAFSDLKILIKGIFKHGKKFTDISISHFFGDLELSKNIFKRKKKNPSEQVFMDKEIPLMMKYLNEHPDIKNLGILFDFYSGIRIGELSALKRSDFKEITLENGIVAHSVHIQRTEIKVRNNKDKWIYQVQDYPKTEAGERDVILTDKAWDIFKKVLSLNPKGEYLFMENDKRIRGNYFNRRLYRVCDWLSIPRRSIHKVRKTFGTLLLDSGVDKSIITEQLGHTDIATTLKYYYWDMNSMDEKVKQMNKALANF